MATSCRLARCWRYSKTGMRLGGVSMPIRRVLEGDRSFGPEGGRTVAWKTVGENANRLPRLNRSHRSNRPCVVEAAALGVPSTSWARPRRRGDRVRRRTFITLLVGAVVAWPLAVMAFHQLSFMRRQATPPGVVGISPTVACRRRRARPCCSTCCICCTPRRPCHTLQQTGRESCAA
jgi:hypothetical protein